MRLVRCGQCGEVADLAKARTCRGCDHPLPEPASAPPPRRIPDAQRDAGSDLGGSRAVLIGLVVAGAIGLILMFLNGGRTVTLAVPLGVVAAVMWRVKPKKEGEAAAQGNSPQVESRRNSSFKKGLKIFLLIVAVLAALAIAGVAIFFIVCLSTPFEMRLG